MKKLIFISTIIDRMENQGKVAENDADGMATTEPNCVWPNKVGETEYGETCEFSCGGGSTCASTCTGPTCGGGATCGSTCTYTCTGYCPHVEGDCGYFHDYSYDWTNWADEHRWVKLFNLGGSKLNETGFGWNGYYIMESVGNLTQIVLGHASKPNYGGGEDWEHVFGDVTFFQDDMTESVNIDLDETDYSNDPDSW